MDGFERWIQIQKISLIAYLLNTRAFPNKRIEFLNFIKRELSCGSVNFLNSIQPSTWRLLLDINPKRLGKDLKLFQSKWQIYYDKICVPKNKNFSILNASKVIAYHLLNSDINPNFLINLARSASTKSWTSFEKQNPEIKNLFKDLFSALRNNKCSVDNRISQITKINEFLKPSSQIHPIWEHVENFLFHQLFCWPIFSLGIGAISLPVNIEVFFDGKGKKFGQRNIHKCLNLVNTDEWYPSLTKCVDVAKQLWRSKHGNYGEFRKKVEIATVIFDFQAAEKIIDGLFTSFVPFDGSMETYFSQAILSRFLGNRSYISSVVTGCIGEQIKDNEGKDTLNFGFVYPANVEQKLEYMAHLQISWS